MKKLILLLFVILFSCSVEGEFNIKNDKIIVKNIEYFNIKNTSKEGLMALQGEIKFYKDEIPIEKLGFFSNEPPDMPPEFFQGYYEDFSSYFKSGEILLKSGEKAFLIRVNNFFFVEYKNKYYFIPTISNIYTNDVSKHFVGKNIIDNEEVLFLDILKKYLKYPKSITIVQGQKSYVLKYKTINFTKNYFQLQNIPVLKKSLGHDFLIEKIGQEISLSDKSQKIASLSQEEFDKIDEKTRNNYYNELSSFDIFSSDGLYLKLTSNYYVTYIIEPPFVKNIVNNKYGNIEGNKMILISNGKNKELKNYSFKETESCGVRNGTYLYVNNFRYTFSGENVYDYLVRNKELEPYITNFDRKEYAKFSKTVSFSNNDLKLVGKMDSKYDIYSFKNKDNEFLKSFYNYAYKGEKYRYGCENCDKNLLTYDQFYDSFPIFFWNDPFGRTVMFISNSIIEPVYCAAKPVIYLYPEEKTEVVLKLNWPKNKLDSIPYYKEYWKVEANINGDIFDKLSNKTYPYLFRDDLVNLPKKDDGFIIRRENLKEFFDEKLSYIGMNEKEINDFEKYWIPNMQDKSYYFISFLQNEELDKIFPLEVSPTPDNILRILMLYEGLNRKIPVKEQKLNKFERDGFVLVEWGGRKN